MTSPDGLRHTEIEIHNVNSSNLEATLIKVSEKLDNFVMEFIYVQ